MIKKLFKKINLKYFKVEDIGLSCDPKVKLKEMPVSDLEKKSAFYKLNNDLGLFEVIKYTKNPELVCLSEVNTDNEIVLSRQAFDFLFSNLPIPKEIEF